MVLGKGHVNDCYVQVHGVPPVGKNFSPSRPFFLVVCFVGGGCLLSTLDLKINRGQLVSCRNDSTILTIFYNQCPTIKVVVELKHKFGNWKKRLNVCIVDDESMVGTRPTKESRNIHNEDKWS